MPNPSHTYTIQFTGPIDDPATQELLDWLAARGFTAQQTEILNRITVTRPILPALTANAEGVDVSSWNWPVDFAAVRDAGRRFAYIRASMGYPSQQYTGRDERFAAHWTAARQAGLMVGAYHYHVWNLDGAQQADNFHAAVGGDYGDLPPVVDVEPRASDTPQVVDRTVSQATLTAFINRIQILSGKAPAIYCSRNSWARMTLEPEWIRNYLLFLADYTGALDLPTHAAFAWMHQYRIAEPGDLTWHPGRLDLDRYLGDNPPAPAPDPEPLFRVRVNDGKVLNVRSVAGSSDPATILRQVSGGDELGVWEVTRPAGWVVDWYRIAPTGQQWISGSTSFTTRL